MANRKFGWHSGSLTAKDITCNNDMTVNGDLTFADANVDSFVLKGRMSSMTAAGSNIILDASYLYTEGVELKYSVTSWTGVGSSFTAAVFRAQSDVASSGKNVTGADIRASSNGYTCGTVQGLYVESNEKDGAANQTIVGLIGGEFNISFYNDAAHTTTLSGESKALYLTIGTASGMNVYTDINGIIIEARDGDVVNRTLGSAIEVRSKSGEGTHTFTTGLYFNTPCTTGISLAGATTTAIAIGGTCTSALDIATVTGTAIDVDASLKGIDIVSTLTGAAALNANIFTVTDATAISSGYSRGLYVNATASGAKTGSGEFDGIGCDLTVSGNTPYAYGFASYVSISGTPTIGQVALFSGYQDDVGNTQITLLDLGSNQTTEITGGKRYAFCRFRNHSATRVPDSLFLIEGNSAATYLATFDTVANMLSVGSDSTNVTHKVAVSTPAGVRYIHLFSD